MFVIAIGMPQWDEVAGPVTGSCREGQAFRGSAARTGVLAGWLRTDAEHTCTPRVLGGNRWTWAQRRRGYVAADRHPSGCAAVAAVGARLVLARGRRRMGAAARWAPAGGVRHLSGCGAVTAVISPLELGRWPSPP